jgi:hypothetical protein
MKVKIDPSVTPEQQRDPRFLQLWRDTEIIFNSPDHLHYKVMLGLHEAGHLTYARRAGATNIQRFGPVMHWDTRPQYDCPAISRSSVSWTPAIGVSVVAQIKGHIGGFICRREMSDQPNDPIAVEMDLHSCRQWFDENVRTGDDVFKVAVAEAEAEILLDLESESVVDEIWAETQTFVEEVFQPEPAPKPKTTRIKIGRNDACPCGSGKKYKKCHLNQPLAETLTA